MSIDGFSPAEIEFLAENELVTIVPTVSMSEIRLSTVSFVDFWFVWFMNFIGKDRF
jgi:hypothetical protein